MSIDVEVTEQPIQVSTDDQNVETTLTVPAAIAATVTSGLGPAGPAGAAATVTVGTVTTGAPGSSASVVNAGTSSAAILNFTIPAGATGATGATGSQGPSGTAATVSIGTVTTGSPGSSATVTNAGTSSAAVLNFSIPAGATGSQGPAGAAGAAATITIGTVTTGAAGSSASVTNVGTSSAAVLNFSIPAGATGATGSQGPAGTAATVSVGTVTTGAAGSSASVTNSGSSSAAVFDFTIPAGATGAAGPAGETGAAGEQGPPGVVAATAPLTYDSGTQTVALSIGTGLAEVDGNLVLDSHEHSEISGLSPAGVIAVGNAQPGTVYATASLRAPHSDTAFAVERWVDGSLVAGCVLGVRDTDAILQSLSSAIVRIETSGGVLATVQLDEVKFSDDTIQSTAFTGSIDWADVTSTPTDLAGYGITDAVGSSDSRLTDARTPTAHKTSHATGGSDALAPSDIGAQKSITSGTAAPTGGSDGDIYLQYT